MKTLHPFFAFVLAALCLVPTALAQSTTFSYQGRLTDNGSPANGLYDLRCIVYNADTGGNQQGPILTNTAVAVSNGLFTVPLDFGNVFDGSARWLEISVRTNGSALAYTTLSPRQPVTRTPYAIQAATAATATSATSANSFTGSLSGDVTGTQGATVVAGVGGQSAANVAGAASAANAATSANMPNALVKRDASGNFSAGTITATSFSGSGVNLASLNASQLSSGTVPAAALGNAWQIGGNSGTTPGAYSVGTTDNQPLEFKVNGSRALRLEPNATSPNVIGGYSGNYVAAGVVSATISGGGLSLHTNSIFADYSTIGGGFNNTIQTIAGGSTIGGGSGNTIQTTAGDSTIGGGVGNTIQTNAALSTIGGGLENTIQTNAYYSTIGGGRLNTIQTNAYLSTIGGGFDNTIQTNAYVSAIGGGWQNTIQTNGQYAVIPGGRQNLATNYAFAAGYNAQAIHTGAFVWSDSTGTATASTAPNQFLIRAAGGVGIGTTSPQTQLHVVGGGDTQISIQSSDSGGRRWTLQSSAGTSNGRFEIVDRTAQASRMAIVAGGWVGFGTTTPATQLHVVSSGLTGISVETSGSGGRRWTLQSDNGGYVGQPGRFEIMDNTAGAASRMAIVGGGEVGFGIDVPNYPLHMASGAYCSYGGQWVNASDRNVKENFAPVDTEAVLAKVASLPVTTWNYKSEANAIKHVGPTAQDFHAAFGLGDSDKAIGTVDEGGVALAAIQGLNQKLEERLKVKDAEIQELRQQLNELKAALENLPAQRSGGGQ